MGQGRGCLPGGTVLGCAGISTRAFLSLRRRGHVAVTLDGLRSLQPLMAHTREGSRVADAWARVP